MRWLGRTLLAGVVVACAPSPATRPPEPHELELPGGHPLAGYRAAFALTWQGSRMGGAVESLETRPDALHFVREERIVIRRGDLLVPYQTLIIIDTDLALRATRVAVTRRAGAVETTGGAERLGDGRWRAWFGDAPARTLPAHAVPAELVPLLVAGSAGRSFRGTIFMPGSGFAVAELAVRAAEGEAARPPRRVVAEVLTDVGELRSVVLLTAAGTVARVLGGDAVGAARVDAAALAQPFDPPELVDGGSIPVTGPAPGESAVELVVGFDTGMAGAGRDVARRRPPPPLPGQQVTVSGDRWQVMLVPGDGSGRADAPAREQVAALARSTAAMLEDDLGVPATEASAALALGRGDCTAHAVLFAELAEARGIQTRLVTGYRLDGGRLVRHRWALAAVGGAWMAIDPTFGEAPARARLLGLATHGTSADELSLVDSVAFAGMSRAHAALIR